MGRMCWFVLGVALATASFRFIPDLAMHWEHETDHHCVDVFCRRLLPEFQVFDRRTGRVVWVNFIAADLIQIDEWDLREPYPHKVIHLVELAPELDEAPSTP